MIPIKTYTVVDNVSDLQRFVAGAKSGDRCTYHVGELARDRLPESGDNAIAVDILANYATRLYREGKIILLQKRLRHDACAYIAVRL